MGSEFDICGLKWCEECVFIGSIELYNGCSVRISINKIIYCEKFMFILDIFEVLIIESELGIVVVKYSDVEDVYCIGCYELGVEYEVVGCCGVVGF